VQWSTIAPVVGSWKNNGHDPWSVNLQFRKLTLFAVTTIPDGNNMFVNVAPAVVIVAGPA
jgi:hypothetical protein